MGTGAQGNADPGIAPMQAQQLAMPFWDETH